MKPLHAWVLALAAAAGAAHAVPAASLDALAAAAAPADRSILKSAQAVPPEFAADALLRMAQWPGQPREPLLALAWTLAAQAPNPLPSVAPASDAAAGTVLDRVDRSGLDRLSLQSRVIAALAQTDPAGALEKFQRLAPSPALRYDCDAAALSNPAPYYEAAAAVMGRLPDAAQQQALFMGALATLRNEMQVAPLLRLFASLPRLPQPARTQVNTALAGAIDRVRGDDPMFSHSSSAVLAATGLALRTLDPMDRSTVALRQAVRNYLLAHFQAPRCKAHVEGEVFAHETQSLRANAVLLGLPPDQVDALHRPAGLLDTASSAAPQPPPGEAYDIQAWSLAQRILDDPAGQASSREHAAALQAFLDAMRRAAGPDTPAFDLYRARVGALRRLAELLPAEALKQATRQALFELLESSPLYAVDRAAWFNDARAVLDGAPAEGRGDTRALQGRLLASSHPVFRLYGALAAREGRAGLR